MSVYTKRVSNIISTSTGFSVTGETRKVSLSQTTQKPTVVTPPSTPESDGTFVSGIVDDQVTVMLAPEGAGCTFQYNNDSYVFGASVDYYVMTIFVNTIPLAEITYTADREGTPFMFATLSKIHKGVFTNDFVFFVE